MRYVDAAILRDENTDTDGLCDDARVYYLTDANFNVTALIDAAGAVVERYVYTPYGEVTIYNADWSATRDASAVDNAHLYTGRDLDGATGLYYYRARWYDAGQGNFLQRDPLGFAAGDANLYRYCGGSPTGSVDPSGLLADGNHNSGGSYDDKWYSHRDDALRDSAWNLVNPMSPGFLLSYLGDAVWHGFSSAPGLARGAFVDGRARVDDKYSSADDTLVNRSLHALESSVYYAGEAGAYGGIGLGAYGMGGFNWAVGQQTGVFNVENWEKVDDFVQDLTTTKPPKKTGPDKHNRSLKFEKLEERAAEGAPVFGNTLKPR